MVFTINICQLHYLNLLCVDYSYMKLFFVFSWELTWFNSREALYLPNGRPRFGNRFDFPGFLPEKTEHVIQVIYLVTVGEGTEKWEQRERTAELSHKPLQRSPASKLCCHQGWEQQATRGCSRNNLLANQTEGDKKQSPFWWEAALESHLFVKFRADHQLCNKKSLHSVADTNQKLLLITAERPERQQITANGPPYLPAQPTKHSWNSSAKTISAEAFSQCFVACVHGLDWRISQYASTFWYFCQLIMFCLKAYAT